VGQPGYFGTDGKDIGVDFVALAAAQQGSTSPQLSLVGRPHLLGLRRHSYQRLPSEALR
jgi:hypothetical protein